MRCPLVWFGQTSENRPEIGPFNGTIGSDSEVLGVSPIYNGCMELGIGKALEKGIEAALGPATRLLEKIAGSAFDELDQHFGDRVRQYRFKNQLRVFAKLETFVLEAGFDPRSIPLKTLFPLLDYSSLEDDENMQARWAALLANAANPDSSVEVPPSFPEILKTLSPDEAKLLDGIYDICLSAEIRTWGSPRLPAART